MRLPTPSLSRCEQCGRVTCWDPFRRRRIHMVTGAERCDGQGTPDSMYAEFGECSGKGLRGGRRSQHRVPGGPVVRQGTIFVDHEGERVTLSQLALRTGVSYSALYQRMLRGKLLTVPAEQKRN